jgi:hypothetical protein
MKRCKKTKSELLEEVKKAMIDNIMAYNKCFKQRMDFFTSKNYVQLLPWVHPMDRGEFREQLRKLETCNN